MLQCCADDNVRRSRLQIGKLNFVFFCSLPELGISAARAILCTERSVAAAAVSVLLLAQSRAVKKKLALFHLSFFTRVADCGVRSAHTCRQLFFAGKGRVSSSGRHTLLKIVRGTRISFSFCDW